MTHSPARPEIRLSVFIPNYNHARFLPEALDAILGQSVQPYAIWILDDGSTDESCEVIAKYAAAHPHIHAIYRKENRGVTVNLNEWLATAKEELVFFAASDDKIMPGLFERSIALLRAYPQAGLCSALSRLMAPDGRDLGPFITPRVLAKAGFIEPYRVSQLLMSVDSWFMGNTTIYRLSALQQAGGFDVALGGFCDGYISRVIALTHGACFIPDDLAYWRRMRTGVAAQSFASAESVKIVAEYAVALMKGPHAAIFPKAYHSRWERRWRFAAASEMIQNRNRVEREKILHKLFGLRPKIFISFLAAFSPRIIRVILFIFMRPWDIGRVFLLRYADNYSP